MAYQFYCYLLKNSALGKLKKLKGIKVLDYYASFKAQENQKIPSK